MRIPNAEHQARPWVMGRIAPDFQLLDVWALPVEGDADQLQAFLETMSSFDPAGAGSTLSRMLFWVRFRLGELLGWDGAAARPIPGCTESSLSDRLPAGLRGSADQPVVGPAMQDAAGGFVPLFRTADEWAAEISNATVHGVLQLTWVPRGNEVFGANMAIYVKPRGLLGKAYMRLIDPFRHLIVYPSLLRHVGRQWDSRHR